jgi:hypoxanthine phosphoribosyltransferase
MRVSGSMGESSIPLEGLPSLKGYKVLIVDDEADARSCFPRCLNIWEPK